MPSIQNILRSGQLLNSIAHRRRVLLMVVAIIVGFAGTETSATDDELTFENSAAPLFNKYCTSCHNPDDNEGELNLESAAQLAKGGESGPALFPGDAKSSRLVRMMLGQLEPKMPPEDSPGPTQPEMERLIEWIDSGAKSSSRVSLAPKSLSVPELEPRTKLSPVTDLAYSPNGNMLAVARYKTVEIIDTGSGKIRWKLEGHPGKVNSVAFSTDSTHLLVATGVAGLYGEAVEWDLAKKKPIRKFGPGESNPHRDILYSAIYSPDGKAIATAGYDRKLIIWERQSGRIARKLEGHNDAIYDLAFSKDGQVLASASGDQTIKLWNTNSGQRLDTLGQPLKEQFVTLFHPTKKLIFGAGRDNRIRQWKLISDQKVAISPLLVSRFAHEASIVALAMSPDSRLLVSSAEDGTIKVWNAESVELLGQLPSQPAVAFGLSVTTGNRLSVGRVDGSVSYYALNQFLTSDAEAQSNTNDSASSNQSAATTAPIKTVAESEPNHEFNQAQKLEVPVAVSGVLNRPDHNGDDDYFRFSARKGSRWVIETNAARSKSPADTRIEVLFGSGKPVPRALLQAVRDSYFTFRGKDSFSSDDFRVHNWQEMELNEYLFCNGELVKLFLYPRGPDSGFKVYPGFGSRHNFLDTTPIAHALQEPCYVVKLHPPQATIVPNGLPTFRLKFENDDDAKRELGRDSRIFFTAPADGEYLVHVEDARGFQGADFKYTLQIRPMKPDFNVSFSGVKMTLKRGSAREFSIKAKRLDDFQGAIDVSFENVPEGIRFPRKVRIQENHFQAFGSVYTTSDAPSLKPEQLKNIKIVAQARIEGRMVARNLGNISSLKIEDKPRIQLRITPAGKQLGMEEQKTLFTDKAAPVELTIAPGQTISANVVLNRLNHQGDVDLGKEESGRNLPHGVFVDNIGLNGLRIIKGQGDTREFFITAAKWVPEQDRLFHLKANNVDGETTVPVLLKVRKQPSKE